MNLLDLMTELKKDSDLINPIICNNSTAIDNYDIDMLEDFITYLHKNGYNNKKIINVFKNNHIFSECYTFFLKTIE
tara:strand:- start:777 stop:1004 length:228 start_codon:yes stop_codon:yes gene_type:complete